MKIKYKTCKVCKKQFEVNIYNRMIVWCSIDCGYKWSTILKAKKDKKQKIAEKKAAMKFSDYLKLFQITFNTYIRLRDKDLPCISCGVYKCEEFHAGHYCATTYQYLRFNENNVHKQCSKCNTHLRGNSIPYRIELIKKIGLENVEQLENDRHKRLELTIPEIIQQIKIYKEKIKLLK